MALPQVTGVAWWEMGISHYKALYRRHRQDDGPSKGYTKDFLQGPRPIRDALRTMFRGAPPPYENLTYLWPGGSFKGFMYLATDRRLEVGQWTKMGAPGPWRIGDPSSDPLVTLAGSVELAIPDDASAQWAQLEKQKPWLVMVQLDWSRTDLHLRAYLARPPRGRQDTSLSRVPESLRKLMKNRGGAVLGEGLPDLWFDPGDLRDPWRVAPEGEVAIISTPTPSGRAARPLGAKYKAANESARRKRADPFEVDPDQLDRATNLHGATQNALSAAVERRGCRPCRPIDEPNYDLAWEESGYVVVAEIKSVKSTNVERQLRLGLGQVLRYRSMLEDQGRNDVRSILALSGPPHDDRWVKLCRQHEVALIWMPEIDAMLGAALDA
jgi:hypothetical protein